MKQLRDYQEVACDYISKRLNNYKRPFIYCLACGTGKSIVVAELAKKGLSEAQIHDYCLDHHGLDYEIKDTPTKTPQNNPDWVGGGANAKKRIKVQ